MHRYVRPLTSEEHQALHDFMWSSPWRIARRALAILLSAQKFTIEQLTTICGVNERTIRNWLDAYEATGVAGLQEAERSGRPRRTTTQQDEHIAHLVEKDPTTVGYRRTVWSVGSLCAHLVKTGISIGAATLRRRLHALKFRWRRPRLAVVRRDPEGAKRMQVIMEALFRASPDTHILVGDETKVEHIPVLRAMWTRLASQFRIPTPPDNRFFYICNRSGGIILNVSIPKFGDRQRAEIVE